jgi:lipopolysaccharide export system permease protein
MVLLRLKDGVILDSLPGENEPRTFRFQQHDWQVDLPEVGKFRSRGGKEREQTLHELILDNDGKLEPLSETAAWGAFFDRSIRSISILFLPFLAIGLGVVSKRQQRSLGMVVGLVMLLTLHKMVEFALASANLGTSTGLMSMLVPFAVFVALSLFFFHTTAHRVGASPLAWLEALFDSIAKLFQKLTFQSSQPQDA